jgi:excisionase family DNA binding protein
MQNEGSTPRLLFSIKQAAAALGIGERTLHRQIAAKQIAVRRIGRRVMIAADVLTSYAKRGPNQSRPTPGC